MNATFLEDKCPTSITIFKALQEASLSAFTCLKSTMKTPEQCEKSLQS